MEWKEEVELESGSALSNRPNSVKSICSDGQVSQPESQPKSKFKYEGVSVDTILEALEKKTKAKSNEIAAFTKLHHLKQGDMPLSEFIWEAKRLADLCNYPNDQDRLIGDMIVS